MEKELKGILRNVVEKDTEFDEYVNNKCINALSDCKEYMEKECSGIYSEEELSVLRENYIFKVGFVSALQLVFGIK